jgi:hypothetical protein
MSPPYKFPHKLIKKAFHHWLIIETLTTIPATQENKNNLGDWFKEWK